MKELIELLERRMDEVALAILGGGMKKEEYDLAINTRVAYASVIDMIKEMAYLEDDDDDE